MSSIVVKSSPRENYVITIYYKRSFVSVMIASIIYKFVIITVRIKDSIINIIVNRIVRNCIK